MNKLLEMIGLVNSKPDIDTAIAIKSVAHRVEMCEYRERILDLRLDPQNLKSYDVHERADYCFQLKFKETSVKEFLAHTRNTPYDNGAMDELRNQLMDNDALPTLGLYGIIVHCDRIILNYVSLANLDYHTFVAENPGWSRLIIEKPRKYTRLRDRKIGEYDQVSITQRDIAQHETTSPCNTLVLIIYELDSKPICQEDVSPCNFLNNSTRATTKPEYLLIKTYYDNTVEPVYD